MSTSTDAHLYYGFDLGEEEGEYPDDPLFDPFRDQEDEYPDFEEIFMEKKGYPYPPDDVADRDKALRVYWKKKDQLLKEANCEIDSHCSGEYPIYFVTITEAHLIAKRGCSEVIHESEFTVKPEWEQQLRDYCALMGITWREPAWRLASYWG